MKLLYEFAQLSVPSCNNISHSLSAETKALLSLRSVYKYYTSKIYCLILRLIFIYIFINIYYCYNRIFNDIRRKHLSNDFIFYWHVMFVLLQVDKSDK